MWCSTVVCIVTFILSLLTGPLATDAQQARIVPRIGYLESLSPADAGVLRNQEALWQGLRERGYVEGQSLTIAARFAEGKLERLPALAAELAQLPVDVIVTWGPGIAAAKQATTTLPIVMASTMDAVGIGFVASLARPGGNVTGLTLISIDLMGKRLELLQQTVPHLSRLALLTGPASPGTARLVQATEVAARALGWQLHVLEVRQPDDVEHAFAVMAREQVEALYVMESPALHAQHTRLVALATESRMPTMFGVRRFVDAGGLMVYGADPVDLWRRAAYYVDRILKGAKPADLPVEQPTKFELVINLKTAQALGLTIPPALLFQADEVIK